MSLAIEARVIFSLVALLWLTLMTDCPSQRQRKDLLKLGCASVITFTRNHQKVKNLNTASEKPACDRFRILVFLDEIIEDGSLYEHVARAFTERVFPEADKSCIDCSRQFYASTGIDPGYGNSLIIKGDCVSVKDYAEKTKMGTSLPASNKGKEGELEHINVSPVDYFEKPIPLGAQSFFKDAPTGIPGSWNRSLNQAVFLMAAAGLSKDEVLFLVGKFAPGPLDKNDKKAIDSAYLSGKKKLEAGLTRTHSKPSCIFGKGEKNKNQLKFISFIETYEITYNLNGSFNSSKGPVDERDLSAKILFETNLSKTFIDSGLTILKSETRRSAVDALKAELAYKPRESDNSEIEKFTKALTGQVDPVDLCFVKHFLYQVKRKLYGLPVKHHMMLLLYGRSGTGKSEAIKRLINPFSEFVFEGDLSALDDSRYYHALSENFIGFIDELGKAQRADVNTLKRIITSENVSSRLLGTNTVQRIKNNCSFIAGTNRSVEEAIYDPTSSRRYAQIHVPEKCDWGAINSIDYIKLWQGIDENLEGTYLDEHFEAIKKRQEGYRAKDSVESFVADLKLGDCTARARVWVSVAELYNLYKEYCSFAGFKSPKAKQGFGASLTNLGIEKDTKNNMKGRYVCLDYNARFKEAVSIDS